MPRSPSILLLLSLASAAAGQPTLQDEGVTLPNQPLAGLNFSGGNVTCVDNVSQNRVDCSIGTATESGVTLNVPVDTDGDGAPDFAYAGDWDGDGNLEIEDVRAALASLTDSDGRLLRVGAGVYTPSTPISNTLIALPDHTTLACDPGTVLRGYGTDEPALSVHVVTNEDSANGNVDVALIGCEIDGGLCQTPDCYGGNLNGSRIGVFFDSVTDLRVLRNQIHDTHHACLYLRNNTRAWIDGNSMERCGGINSFGPNGQPCFYLFAKDSKVQSDMLITGNYMTECRVNAINFRVGDATSFHRDYAFRNNVVVNTRKPESSCLVVQGIENVVVDGLRCQDSNGPIVGPGAVGGLDRYPYDHNVNQQISTSKWMGTERTRNVVLRNLQIVGYQDGPGLTVSEYSEDVLLEKIVIEGKPDSSGGDCLYIRRPQRRLTVRGLTARRCASDGIQMDGLIATSEEHIFFEDVEIDTVAADDPQAADKRLVKSETFAEGIHFDGLVLRNPRGDFTSFPQGLAHASFRNVWADGLYPGFLGTHTIASASGLGFAICDTQLEGKWLTLTDLDGSCSFPWGTGGQTLACRCLGGMWNGFLVPSASVFRPGTSPWTDVLLENVYAQNLPNAWAIDFGNAAHDGIVIRNGFASEQGLDAMPGQAARGFVDWPTASGASGLSSSDVQCNGTSDCEAFHGHDDDFQGQQRFTRPVDGTSACQAGQHNVNSSTGEQQICIAGGWQPLGTRPFVGALGRWLPQWAGLVLVGIGIGYLARDRRAREAS